MEVTIKPRSWLEKFLDPDRRRAERWVSPGLSISYWNGWAPKQCPVKDISSSGIYLKTEPEWSPGVTLMLTLQRKDLVTTDPACWISVQAEVVRRGRDGLGLRLSH